jgi:adenylyltransferase/sulfurtransferase
VLPGIIDLLGTNEAIRHILDLGAGLAGRMLMFDALEMAFRDIKPWRDPRCPVWGEGDAIDRSYAGEFCEASCPD